MKSTGMVRNVDILGRIVLPKEMRGTLDIAIQDPLEIFFEDDEIILKKYNPGCLICGEMGEVIYFKGHRVCQDCIAGIKTL